jgi:hypothetical protein
MTDSADDFAPIHSRSHIPRSLPRWLTSPYLPLALLCAYLVAAFFLVLFKLSKYMWFNLDEWYFLAGRDATTIDGLFAPHNEHWTTLPILAFRAMYGVVGLHSYRPYQAMVVLTHGSASGPGSRRAALPSSSCSGPASRTSSGRFRSRSPGRSYSVSPT